MMRCGARSAFASPEELVEDVSEDIICSPEGIAVIIVGHIGPASCVVCLIVVCLIAELPCCFRVKAGFQSHVGKFVIELSFFRVAQYIIGLCNLLEDSFSLGIILIGIRVIFLGQPAVGAFDLLVGGGLRQAKDFIEVSFVRHDFTSFLFRSALTITP